MLTNYRTAILSASLACGSLAVILKADSIRTAVIVVGALVALVAAMVLCSCHIAATIRAQAEETRGTVRATNRPADKAYIDGYDDGYDKGWRDARKHERPVAVPFLQRSACESVERLGVELKSVSDTV